VTGSRPAHDSLGRFLFYHQLRLPEGERTTTTADSHLSNSSIHMITLLSSFLHSCRISLSSSPSPSPSSLSLSLSLSLTHSLTHSVHMTRFPLCTITTSDIDRATKFWNDGWKWIRDEIVFTLSAAHGSLGPILEKWQRGNFFTVLHAHTAGLSHPNICTHNTIVKIGQQKPKILHLKNKNKNSRFLEHRVYFTH